MLGIDGVNPGDAVGPESWLSRYISDSIFSLPSVFSGFVRYKR